jgi:hypothetical protein
MSIIPPKPTPKTYKTRSIRVQEHILERIEEIRKEQNVSANYVIEKLLEYALQQYDTSPKPKK